MPIDKGLTIELQGLPLTAESIGGAVLGLAEGDYFLQKQGGGVVLSGLDGKLGAVLRSVEAELKPAPGYPQAQPSLVGATFLRAMMRLEVHTVGSYSTFQLDDGTRITVEMGE